MNELANYTFLPWLREGLGNQITGQTGQRATIPITLKIEGNALQGDGIISDTVPKTVQIYGPGDITGIDRKAIIKMEPRNWITNFEPNYLPYIDFYKEGFPWQYSPEMNPGDNRLKPWLALIVLKEDEFTNGKNIKDKPLPYIQFTDKAQLQDSSQLWAWAHVHINRDLLGQDASGEEIIKKLESDGDDIAKEVGKILSENPDLGYSRIVCPRKLEEKVAYHAFLVPAFESGRLTGLGQDIPPEVTPTKPAWPSELDDPEEAGTAPLTNLQMPYYHRWYFRTGTIGDFEYLVRLLEPKPVDRRVGLRDMDVQQTGANLKGIIDDENTEEAEKLNGILKLGGALRIPRIFYTEDEFREVQNYEYWAFRKESPPPELEDMTTTNQHEDLTTPHPFQKSLAAFVNLTDSYETTDAETANGNTDIIEQEDEAGNVIKFIDKNPDPLITAPLYGRWHALTQRLLKERDGSDIDPNYSWVQELNLDPRWRVSAGFGTKVVQENQEDYMKAAWEQVGEIVEANRIIRQAQAAKVVTGVWHEVHMQPIKNKRIDKWLSLSSPVHKRIISRGVTNIGEAPKPTTVFFQKKESQITTAATSVNMRKMLRPRGKFVKRLSFDENITPENIITRINNGEVSPAPPKITPEGIQSSKEIAAVIQPQNIPECLMGLLEQYPGLKWLPLVLALVVLLVLIFFPPALILLGAGLVVIGGLVYLYRQLDKWSKQLEMANSILEENETPESVDEMPNSPDFRISSPGENFTSTKGGEDSEESKRFKIALKEVNGLVQESTNLGEVKVRPMLDIARVNETVYENLDPKITIPRWINGIILLPPFIIRQIKEQFKEAMAYPKIDLPMYKPLATISAELFLPNINFIDQNSISLLETNQKFIESYMVGLNHEFARELLWREYPTDQRGSYFRQFWDVSGFLDTSPPELNDLINRYNAILTERKSPELKEYADRLKDPNEPKTDALLQEARTEILKEELKDIKPLHYWGKKSKLGQHDNREKPGDEEEEVVLVIRGELLKKYPTAVIYAHKADWNYKFRMEGETVVFLTDENGDKIIDLTRERTLAEIPVGQESNPPSDIIKSPLYEAKVDPDIYFFGFDLTVCEAKGGTGDIDLPIDELCADENIDPLDPGWFFVIKERPGEPRFGLDVPSDPEPGEQETIIDNKIELWNDLSWDDLTPPVSDGDFIRIDTNTSTVIKATQDLEPEDDEKKEQQKDDEKIDWHADMSSAELAYILYQVPVLVAVHAGEMLPKPPTF